VAARECREADPGCPAELWCGRQTDAAANAVVSLGMARSLCRQFGLPDTAGGVTTTGGSLTTLVAMAAPRHDRLGDDFASGTVYVTAHTHRCLAKAARLAGLPAGAIRTVPTTPDLRMDPEAAAQMIARDRARGLRPFLLVGSAGTTSTGAVDPIGELAQLARSEGLWNHVDAAYGGFFQLTERGRARFAGIEHADSVVLDPHKGLFLPHGTGILLVRTPPPCAPPTPSTARTSRTLTPTSRCPTTQSWGLS
jgi:aromatic-L-amino-acid decarboxylase